MKRILLVVLFGLLCGTAGHFACLYVQQPHLSNDNLDAQLSWIKTDLQLTPAQYARIKAIHEQSSPHLLKLASRVARMREEFSAFERQRKTAGEIDFLEFARFIEERRRIDSDCLLSSRQIVDASAEVLTADQRQRYFTLVPPALRPAPPRIPN